MPNNVQQQTLVRIFTDTLAAGAQKIYQVGQADHLFLLANSQPTGTLGFSFDNNEIQGLLTGQIVAAQGDPNIPAQLLKFSELLIINNGANSATYTIVVANGAIDFKALVISGLVTTSDTGTVLKTYAQLTADNTSTINQPANSKRKELWIYNSGATAVLCGDSSVSATKGIYIPAGAQIILTCQDKIYFYCNGTSNINCTENNYS